MQMTIHCPALYDLAEDDARMRGAIIQLLMRTVENPWILPMDGRIRGAMVAAIKRWPDQTDQEQAMHLLKHLAGSVNHFVGVPMPEEPQEPLLRAHQMASRDPAYWLVDLLEHRGRGDFPVDPSSVKQLDDLLMMGLEEPWETGKVLPPRPSGDKVWSREEFSEVVWQPIFRWTKTLGIYDRNIVKHWNDGHSRYPMNLLWILEEFAECQAGGEVTLAVVGNSDRQNLNIVGDWCGEREISLGITIKILPTLSYSFHDRYFYTQQGWWRSHRGVDLCKYQYRQQQWVMEADAELTWQAYPPPTLALDSM